MGCITCCCCSSSKGACFFCTSVHIFFAMYLSVKWIVVTYVNGLNEEYFEDHRMRVIYPLLLIYLSIFLILGCINFIAVERESTIVLKWSMRAFLLLQISMLLTNTLLAFTLPEADTDLPVHRFYHVKFMVINVVTTSIYYYVVWRFIFSLENGIYIVHKKKTKCLPSNPSGVTSPNSGHLDSQPSAPSPWSETDSVDRLDRRQDNQSRQPEQAIPLKSTIEPQPCCSSRS